jgi:hypothetical protein
MSSFGGSCCTPCRMRSTDIRHVGLLANGHRTTKLTLCRASLTAPTPDPPPPENYRARTRRLTGHALDVCPHVATRLWSADLFRAVHSRRHRCGATAHDQERSHRPTKRAAMPMTAIGTDRRRPMTDRMPSVLLARCPQRIIYRRSPPRPRPIELSPRRQRPTPMPWRFPRATAQATQRP